MTNSPAIDLVAEIDELPELLPVPATALRLVTACQDKNVGARDLCQIINCDPGLSFSLLRISNSSRYGFGGKIKTLEHATVVLGTKGIRDLAVSVMASGLFDESAKANPAADLLWTHSLACATVAKHLAKHTELCDPDEAFMSGIIHDIGKLVMIQILEDKYDLIPDALSGISTTTIEAERFGICHAELASRCADEWGLPLETSDALRDHHEAYDPAIHSELTGIVAAANQLAKIWNIGVESTYEESATTIAETYHLPLSESELEEIAESSLEEYHQNHAAFES